MSKRFGHDTASAAAAWRRLLGNSCPDTDFAQIANEGRPTHGIGILFRLGVYPRGIGRTRDPAVRDRVIDVVCLYESTELAALIRDARKGPLAVAGKAHRDALKADRS